MTSRVTLPSVAQARVKLPAVPQGKYTPFSSASDVCAKNPLRRVQPKINFEHARGGRAAEFILRYRNAKPFYAQPIGAFPHYEWPTATMTNGEDASYIIQQEWVRQNAANTGKHIGYKIGATNQGARTTLKLKQPFYGNLFEKSTTASGVASTFEASKFWIRVIEPEVAIEIAEDLPIGEIETFTKELIQKNTSLVFPAIEIVNTPWAAKWKEVGGEYLIADNGAHGNFILGEGVKPENLDAEGVKVTLEVNGKVQREGKGSNVDGGAFAATAWLANFLKTQGVSLKKGQIITTGTTTVPWEGNGGETIKANFSGLGSAELTFRGGWMAM